MSDEQLNAQERRIAEVIRMVMPRCVAPLGWAPPLRAALDRFSIEDPDAIAVFLAQIAVESAEMNRLEENLNYSAPRLMAVWPRRFPTVAVAQQYAHSPERLANMVYGGRMGNTEPGDGFRFRGRGLKMITGKDNYRACGRGLGRDLLADPGYLRTKSGAAMSAAWYWSSRGLTALADDLPDDDDEEDFRTITKRINGGYTGLAQRHDYWVRAKRALGLT